MDVGFLVLLVASFAYFLLYDLWVFLLGYLERVRLIDYVKMDS